ncbi:hypothetical protein LSTR_LSTR014945 [Laodelphax striatellus]|uniref:Uncharacterized protein n=1 Tax=Laodelphax striatellus TaxID=195883 RepID=A0A482XHV3_LAOST|nr:hypothetical protein LSTR_LSTR014945 [Laodelphax striatellus]
MVLFMLVTLAIKLLRSDANEDRMVAMKLRQNDAACLLLNKTHFPNSSGSVNDFEALSKKIPLLYQYDRTPLPPGSYLGNRVNLLYPVLPGGQQQHVEQNKTNAKLNNVTTSYNTPGLDQQPLLKINSVTHSQQANCNTFGAMPWGAGVLNDLGQNFCPDAANMSAALNQFVSNVSGCQLSAPQNVSNNLSSSVHLGKSAPCCSEGANVGNIDGANSTTSDTTLENPSATLESDGATCSANLQNVSAIDGATTIDSSTTNHANFLNLPATNLAIASTDGAASDTTSGNIAATSGNVSATSRIGTETCCDHLETSKTNMQCAAPCNISSPQGSHTFSDPRMSTDSAVSSQKHNAFPCSASSLLGVNATNTPIPVFGPFACITTQASSDEHPIFSLQINVSFL